MKIPLLLILVAAFSTSCKKKDITPAVPILPVANGLPVTVNVNQTAAGYIIPSTFEGLSYEANILASSAGFLNTSNTVLIQLIKNLGPGILRVGGNSSDKTYWTGKPRGANTGTDSLTTSDIDDLSAFSSAIGWKVLFGLNMGVYNPTTVANEAAYVNNSLKNNLFALQNGNEPDLYANNGLRTSGYTYINYQSDWNNYFQAIENVLPSAQFAGPDVADNKQWIASFATSENKNVLLIDGHYYRTGPASDTAINYETILTTDTKLPTYLQVLNSSSSKYNLTYRISECNSVYDGGKKGVSDVFASALWALDYMWTVAENNGTGINFHGGSGGAYSPIVSTNGITTPRPIYYAMLAFKYGGTGGTIVPATITSNQYNCSSYACINNGVTYLTLINKETSKNISFNIQLSNTATVVKIQRLTAPGITANTGITFAGSTVNANGTFTPGAAEQYAVNQKTLIVNVPAGSAAVVAVQ